MDERSRTYVGLDVHKDSISVGLAEPGRESGRLFGKTAHDVGKLNKLLGRIRAPEQLHLVYEAAPTGYGLQRALAAAGYSCEVIAPSQIPRRAGDRIKADGRDCVQLAECSRAGQLRAVWIPEPADEAIRDLSRAREDAVNSRTQARHQLKGFLLRYGLRYTGKTSWIKTYHAWLGSLRFEKQPAQTAFTEYWLAVQAADARVQRLTQALRDAVTGWRFEPVLKALQALRGVDLVTGVGLVAEIGDLRRFEHPRKLMGYLGLVPSESSSGDRIQRGSITKTGNAHARRLLTEAAWHYRFKARIGRHAQARQQELSQDVRELAWNGQLRLNKRFTALQARGVQVNKGCDGHITSIDKSDHTRSLRGRLLARTLRGKKRARRPTRTRPPASTGGRVHWRTGRPQRRTCNAAGLTTLVGEPSM